MSKDTQIAWTDHTFNIAWGCSKISPGCKNCYADTLSHRWGLDFWDEGKNRRTFGAKYWSEPLAWNVKAQADGVRQRVFCSSMCDVFEDHPTIDAEREKLWPLIRQTPWLDWQLLTKRAERIAENLPADWGSGYGNVWLGVSVESGDYEWRFNEHLAHIPCQVRFVSYEPALGPVTGLEWAKLGWIIYGGESGKGYRSDQTDWARHVKSRCAEFGVSFFYKQGAAFRPGTDPTLDGATIQEFPQSVALDFQQAA
ncbi:MAG: DUF5131 family protein [Proteobacteria bacterium]|nr:DUF5131 family protein [Verrucomicrobiota bacterium]NBU09058.1 DUF5131 family protein [Pseudomonadota bacterium]